MLDTPQACSIYSVTTQFLSLSLLSLQVLPGLYVGNYRDSKDQQQLDHFKITHILAIHDSPRRLLPVSWCDAVSVIPDN